MSPNKIQRVYSKQQYGRSQVFKTHIYTHTHRMPQEDQVEHLHLKDIEKCKFPLEGLCLKSEFWTKTVEE